MPVTRRHGVAAAAAICLAVGGSAALSWAFSVFSESKTKKSSKPSEYPTYTSEVLENDVQPTTAKDVDSVPKNAQLGASVLPGPQPHPKCDFIPEFFYKTSAEKPVIIENTAVSAENGQTNSPLVSKDKDEEGAGDSSSPQQNEFQKDDSPSRNVYTQTRLSQRPIYLSDNYNRGLARSSLTESVRSQLAGVTFTQPPPASPLIDSRVNILETAEPALEEMKEERAPTGMVLSVSCRSLESAVMIAPSATRRPGSTSSGLTGVDNSITELDDSADVATMRLEDVPVYEPYCESVALPPQSAVRVLTPPVSSSNTQDSSVQEKTTGFVSPIMEEITSMNVEKLASADDIDAAKVLSTDVETSSVRSEASVPCYTQMVSIGVRVSEGYYIDLNLSADSLSSQQPLDKTHLHDSLDLNSELNFTSVTSISEGEMTTPNMHLVEFHADIDNSGPLRSEFVLPHMLERELTPDSLADVSTDSAPSDTKERSELQFTLGSRRSTTPNYDDALQQSKKTTPTTSAGSNSNDSNNNKEIDQVDMITCTSATMSESAPAASYPTAASEEREDVTLYSADQRSPVHSPGSKTPSVSSVSNEYSRTQTTEAEELIETSVEETVTMVINGVVINPGAEAGEQIVVSLQEAVERNVLDLQSGLYYNPTTKVKLPLTEAISSGYIQMGPQKVEKSEAKVKSVGRMIVKTSRETLPYKVLAAKDMHSGKMLKVGEAKVMNILDIEKGAFQNLQTKKWMLIGDAVDLGLVEIDYDMDAAGTVQEEISRAYSVHAVVDQKLKVKVAFHEAVERGLIDPETGGYINNATGERVPTEQAIERGFIKATLADDPELISVDDMGNKAAEKGVKMIRNKLLNPLKVLKSLKQ